MSFKLSALLNPAPSSGPASPKSPSKDSPPGKGASPVAPSPDSTSAAPSGNRSTTINDSYNDQDAANMLASLAHISPPPPNALDAHPHDQAARRQSNASILPPLEQLPTLSNHHSSSPTLEEYHHGSNSPEQRRQSEVDILSTPAIKLAPLQGLTPVSPTQNTLHVETPGPPNLPLFVPAQVRADRKPSASAQPPQPSPKFTPPETMMPSSPIDQIADPETRAAIHAATNEYGLRGSRKPAEPKTPTEPAPTVPKKRPAPKSVAANKKGTAKKAAAPPAKKRKTDTDRPRSAGTRSATPVSRQPKSANKGRSSATPAVGSSPASAKQEGDYASEDEDMAVSDGDADDLLFCVCRKPDDHKYMIGCDGGCEDWFHGTCVNISEDDGKLIDKYICPNCEKAGIGETTWKPMCRRTGCRKAARLTNGTVSKYCSQDCGLLFFSNLIEATAEASNPKTKRKAGQKSNKHSKDADHPASKAGPLTPGQLKSLVMDIDDADTFRSLGNGGLNPLTPGLIKSFSSLNIPQPTKGDPGTTDAENLYNLTDAEKLELDTISEKKSNLRIVRTALKDRESYVSMLKERLTTYNDREKRELREKGEKPKSNTVCGYDERLTWTLEQFRRWRESPAGMTIFDGGSLDAPPTASSAANGSTEEKESSSSSAKLEASATITTDDADNTSTTAAEDGGPAVSFCWRRRCERHKMWPKLQLEDVRFEESGLADQMRQLDRAEGELKERASMRWRRDASGLLKHQGTVEMGEGAGFELR